MREIGRDKGRERDRDRSTRREDSQGRSRERTASRSNIKKKEKDIGVPGAGTLYVYGMTEDQGRCESPRRKRLSRGTSRELPREKKTWSDYTQVSISTCTQCIRLMTRRLLNRRERNPPMG